MTDTNQPAEQPVTLKALITQESVQARFENVLGNKSNVFISSLMSAVRGNQQLQLCEPESIISSAMIAATLDLPITPGLGMAHIVPYKQVAQFQVGWKGFIQLALRTGKYKTINATEIYEGQIKGRNPFTGDIEFNIKATSEEVIGYLLFGLFR